MPSWGEVSQEIATLTPAASGGANPYDFVRRKYLATVHTLTRRAIIVYATRWTVPSSGLPISPNMLSINNGDIPAFMEALHGIVENKLDLIIHSPGGSPEAAEAIVLYLRSKFEHIRVFVPHMAMSAATMIACAADEVVMGKHSFIGPIDPQLQLQTSLGVRLVPAQAIVEQFQRAVTECQDPNNIRAWLPMLTQYGPDLLVTCQNANKLSKDLVSDWLCKYMFKNDLDAGQKASAIATWMADHSAFKTHGRPISRDEARLHGMNIRDLEEDSALQDSILSVYHSVALCFAGTPMVKIVENHRGKAFMENSSLPVMPTPFGLQVSPFGIPPTQ